MTLFAHFRDAESPSPPSLSQPKTVPVSAAVVQFGQARQPSYTPAHGNAQPAHPFTTPHVRLNTDDLARRARQVTNGEDWFVPDLMGFSVGTPGDALEHTQVSDLEWESYTRYLNSRPEFSHDRELSLWRLPEQAMDDVEIQSLVFQNSHGGSSR